MSAEREGEAGSVRGHPGRVPRLVFYTGENTSHSPGITPPSLIRWLCSLLVPGGFNLTLFFWGGGVVFNKIKRRIIWMGKKYFAYFLQNM